MRIIVVPERLLYLSRQMCQEAAQLREIERRLGCALGGLDWSVRQQTNVDGWVYDARNRARVLAERAENLAWFLANRAQAFQQADQEACSDWDAFFAPFRVPTSVPTPVPTPTPETGDRKPDPLLKLWEIITTLVQPAALAKLAAYMEVDKSGVAHVYGSERLKELAGVSTHLTRIYPENLAKHLVREELRLSFSPLANLMTVVGLIPTAVEAWQEYSGQGFTAVAAAFLVDANIDILCSKIFQLGGAALSTALLTPVLGPLAPALGSVVGGLVGNWVADFVKRTSLRDGLVKTTTEGLEVIGGALRETTDGMVKTTTEGLEVIGGALRETAEGVQNFLSAAFNKVIVPVK